MKKFKLYEEFQLEELEKAKKDKSRTESYPPPEYVVEPAKGDKGFFMFKNAFDKMVKRFETGFFSN